MPATSNCYVDFNDILTEKMKSPEFVKHYENAGEKLKIELQLNELLQTMGKTNYFVEVKDFAELN
jgi:hypothetical protein